jgi:hypothetical protein
MSPSLIPIAALLAILAFHVGGSPSGFTDPENPSGCWHPQFTGGYDDHDPSLVAQNMEAQLWNIAYSARQLADFAESMTSTEEGRRQLHARPHGSSAHIMEGLSRMQGNLNEAQAVANGLMGLQPTPQYHHYGAGQQPPQQPQPQDPHRRRAHHERHTRLRSSFP